MRNVGGGYVHSWTGPNDFSYCSCRRVSSPYGSGSDYHYDDADEDLHYDTVPSISIAFQVLFISSRFANKLGNLAMTLNTTTRTGKLGPFLLHERKVRGLRLLVRS